jgi:predicted ATP-dependent endonuclease of OLD family
MKICKVYIKGFQQFEDLELDFTNPKTGEPLDKICFIGRNGTGKSTILRILNQIIHNIGNYRPSYFLLVKVKIQNNFFYLVNLNRENFKEVLIYHSDIEKENKYWIEDMKLFADQKIGQLELDKYLKYLLNPEERKNLYSSVALKRDSSDLLVFSPAETSHNNYLGIQDVPETRLNDALALYKEFLPAQIVSNENIIEFWKLLIYLIKKRENDFREYESQEENQNKTVKTVKEEFDRVNPKILNKLSEIWNKILNRAGLEFDVANASNPVQLTDNLKAYIVNKSTKKTIPYNALSTGIRNYIFRIGHIYSLYFNREVKRGFLLLDEPENSLYPDFLFDWMETFSEIIKDKNGENNTQVFISTHNPIIAAQFEPYERIILEWDEKAQVIARKGKSPVGDDPNDILTNDFELKNLMGKAGLAMWNRYVDLKKELRHTDSKEDKEKIILEMNRIGSDYNFDAA